MNRPGDCTTIDKCRISDSADLSVFFDLGRQPLANALLQSPDEDEDVYPLRLGFCPESSLVQLMETVAKEKLFRNYVWVSGTAATTREYAQLFCRRAMKALGEPRDAFVLEIASNDGTFLGPFRALGLKTLGIDPARNLAAEATGNQIETWPEFWATGVARRVLKERGPVDFVFARNVVPHVSEIHEVIRGMAEVMADGGLGMIEFHCADRIFDELHYDSIYHEHLCYFSLHAMEYLLRKHGLHPHEIEFSPISGASIVVHFSKKPRPVSPAYTRQMERERSLGLTRLETWKKFADRCATHRTQVLAMLARFDPRRTIGFGASARSATFTNYCGITKDHMELVIDNNPRKQGLFTPGSHLPVVSFAEGMALRPEAIILLAWNFADEIIAHCRHQGFRGSFIQPFPCEPRVIHEGSVHA
jgi:hypothetical protein